MKAPVGADGDVLNTWIVDRGVHCAWLWLAMFLIGAMGLLHGGY